MSSRWEAAGGRGWAAGGGRQARSKIAAYLDHSARLAFVAPGWCVMRMAVPTRVCPCPGVWRPLLLLGVVRQWGRLPHDDPPDTDTTGEAHQRRQAARRGNGLWMDWKGRGGLISVGYMLLCSAIAKGKGQRKEPPPGLDSYGEHSRLFPTV